MIEIIPDLWIYKYKDIKNLNTNNIEIIDCTKDLCFLTNNEDRIKYELVKLYQYIDEKIKFINNKLLNNKTIIITCKSCKQLSPLIAASYLIKYGQMEILDALKSIRTKKQDVFENEVMFSNILDKIYRDSK